MNVTATNAQLVADYLTACQARGLSHASVTTYRWALAKLPAGHISADALERTLARLRLSRGSHWNVYRHWRAFFRWAARRHGRPNPILEMDRPRKPRALPYAISHQQLERVLAAARLRRDRAMILVLADTGLRIGELARLRPQDIADGRLRVSGKTGERQVPITPEVQRALVGQLPWEIERRAMAYAVTRLLRRAGVSQGGPHVLRHTFATEYIRRGGDVLTLQRILGHASIQQTLVYVELAFGDVQAQHAKFSPALRLLGQAAS